jgi:hypothetical protein
MGKEQGAKALVLFHAGLNVLYIPFRDATRILFLAAVEAYNRADGRSMG